VPGRKGGKEKKGKFDDAGVGWGDGGRGGKSRAVYEKAGFVPFGGRNVEVAKGRGRREKKAPIPKEGEKKARFTILH